MGQLRLVDISKTLGISVSAVSMALDNHPRIGKVTRDRVQKHCLEVGYITRDRLVNRHGKQRRKQAGKTSLRVGFVPVGVAGLDDDTYVVALASALRAEGHRLEVLPQQADDEAGLIASLLEEASSLDAIVLTERVQVSLANAVAANVRNCLVLGNACRDTEDQLVPLACPSVASDIMGLGRLSVQYLLQQGHRRIGLYAFQAPWGSYNDQWRAGCRQALVEAHLPIAPELEHIVTIANADPDDMADYFSSLDEPPTAVVAPSDWMPQVFVQAMLERGCPISMQDIVIGGIRRRNELRGLGEIAQVTQDVEQVSRVATRAITWLVNGELPSPVAMTVPGICWNFKEPKL